MPSKNPHNPLRIIVLGVVFLIALLPATAVIWGWQSMFTLLGRLPGRQVIGALFLVGLILLLVGTITVAHFAQRAKGEAETSAQQNTNRMSVSEKMVVWGGLIVSVGQITLGSAFGIVLGDLSRTDRRPNLYLSLYVIVGVPILVAVTYFATLDRELVPWLDAYRGGAGVFVGSGLGALLSRLDRGN